MTHQFQLTPLTNDMSEITATAQIWGKEVDIFIAGDDFDGALPSQAQLDKITTYLDWLNFNQKSVIDFALNEEDFVANFNDWVEQQINQVGKAELYDNTILTKPITYDEVFESIFIGSVFISCFNNEVALDVDLLTKPDYFGGHAFNVEIDGDFTMTFGGVNG